MLLDCFHEISSILNLSQQLGKPYLSNSFAFILTLCPFMMWVTDRMWGRDFWEGLRTKFSLFKKHLLSERDSSQEQHDKSLFAQLPKSSNLPSITDMAELLVKALPASDRTEAYTLLVTQLLPKKLARLSSHPDPYGYVEAIYESLASALQEAHLVQRLEVLRSSLCEIEIRQLDRDSLILAVARYIKEHPDATDIALDWLAFRDASKWLAMSTIELKREASLLAQKVEQWDEFAKTNHPDVWEQHKLKPFSTRLNLESAYSGSFHAAMGDFGRFLRAVGHSYQNIDLH